MHHQQHPHPHLVAVRGVAGGVGTTSLAVALAARAGGPALIVDADDEPGTVAAAVGVPVDPAAVPASDPHLARDARPVSPWLELLTLQLEPDRPAAARTVADTLTRHRDRWVTIIIDLGDRTDPAAEQLAAAAVTVAVTADGYLARRAVQRRATRYGPHAHWAVTGRPAVTRPILHVGTPTMPSLPGQHPIPWSDAIAWYSDAGLPVPAVRHRHPGTDEYVAAIDRLADDLTGR